MFRCVDRLQSIRHSIKSWLMYHTPHSPVRYLCVDMWLVCLLQAFVLSHMASAASNFTELLSHWSQELVIRHWRKTENIGVLPSDFCENFTSRHTDILCQPGVRLVSIQAEMKVKKKTNIVPWVCQNPKTSWHSVSLISQAIKNLWLYDTGHLCISVMTGQQRVNGKGNKNTSLLQHKLHI